MFKIKDKTLYPACKIYHGVCECGEDYIGETERNLVARLTEHNNPKYNSETAKHINRNIDNQIE